MKSIAVIATDKDYAVFLTEHLSKYLKKYANFKAYSINNIKKLDVIYENIIILPNYKVFKEISDKIDNTQDVIVVSVALTHDQICELRKIPAGTRALLVNFDIRTCMHSIDCIYEAGIRDIELIPYYGGRDYDRSIEVAITPNEEQLVPKGINKIFNVGESAVDMNSLFKIADKLGVYDSFVANEAYEARKEYYYIRASVEKLLGEKEIMLSRMKALIMQITEGILITDVLGRIYLTNDKANKLMRFRASVLEGFYVDDILPELKYDELEDKLIIEDGIKLNVSSIPIKADNDNAGYIIKIWDFEEVEKKQFKIRSQLAGGHHTARYHFEDIMGESSSIKSAINNAKRMSRSNSTVLIIGETGTGKELFAQSIHNESSRSSRNFVAVNCAAIPDNLLESEMFGYEGGAFTGARKGGKPGYFELAHRGSIFLDEIGEMSLQLQAKLLRIIEERRVVRLGSDYAIDVDVRIIAATNKDLYNLVEKKLFREDLYYRINVLSLNLPPLREHVEDIPELTNYYIKKFGRTFSISSDAMRLMMSHNWNGNYRELRNVIEYLSNQGKMIIDKGDLNILKNSKLDASNEKLKNFSNTINTTEFDRFVSYEYNNLTILRKLLKCIFDMSKLGLRPGRIPITQKLNLNGIPVTEAEVRRLLKILSGYGYIVVGKGRAGSRITKEGESALKALEDLTRL